MVAARIAKAREVQASRFKSLGAWPRVRTNAEAEGELLDQIAQPDDKGKTLLSEAVERLKLSARGYHRVLRLARTLADLEGMDGLRRVHIAEAVSYRRIELPR